MSKPIGWGKCSIIVKDLDEANSKWTKIPTPKESTTNLSTTKGDKKEATIEGGDVEDVKYTKNKYAITYAYRVNEDRSKCIPDNDGVVAHRYAIFVQPENIKVPGPRIETTVVSTEDGFDTTDGGLFTYTHDAVSAADGNTVHWSTIEQDLNTIKEGEQLAADPTFTDHDKPSQAGAGG